MLEPYWGALSSDSTPAPRTRPRKPRVSVRRWKPCAGTARRRSWWRRSGARRGARRNPKSAVPLVFDRLDCFFSQQMNEYRFKHPASNGFNHGFLSGAKWTSSIHSINYPCDTHPTYPGTKDQAHGFVASYHIHGMDLAGLFKMEGWPILIHNLTIPTGKPLQNGFLA